MQRPRPLITLSRPMVQRGSALLAVLAFVGASFVGLRLLRGSALSEGIMAKVGKEEPADVRAAADGGASTRLGGAESAAGTGTGGAGEVGADFAPAISVLKTRQSADPAHVGDEVSFVIELRNASHLPLADIQLSDSYDGRYLHFLAAEPAPAQVDEAAGKLAWAGLESALPDGSLDPGDVIRLRVRFTAVAPTDRGSAARNTAEVKAQGGTVVDGPAESGVSIVARPPDADLCLGDLVFMDLGDDRRYDPDAGDMGIAGVALSLYADADGSGDWTEADGLLETLRSEDGGRYRFCGLAPGDYMVMVEPVNFAADAPLAGLRSSGQGAEGDPAADPDDQVDGDDNGLTLGADEGVVQAVERAVVSLPISLSIPQIQAEPQEGAVWNTTLDFGFAMREGIGSGAAPLPGSGAEVELPLPIQEPDPNADPGADPGPEQAEELRRAEPGKPVWSLPVTGKPVWGKPVHPRPRR